MLRYLGYGPRQFGLYPLKRVARMNWEFFAVVGGRCAPMNEDAPRPPLLQRTLWVSAPGSAHTWAASGAHRTHVAVLHYGSVPAPLEAAVRERGQIAVPLTVPECRRVAALARSLEPDFRVRKHTSNLVFQAALIELALLVLRKLPEPTGPLLGNHAERTVEQATSWYAEHMAENPTIHQIAREVHASPSTLRRLFRRVLNDSPARVLSRLQIEASMRMMTSTTLKLDAIAEACGFTCTSDFCRAFKSFTRVTPNLWRQTILTPPRAAALADKNNAA